MKALFTALTLWAGAVLADTAPDFDPEAEARQIDRLLSQALRVRGSVLQPPASDSTFLRRSYLSLQGRIPSFAEAKAFLDDSSTRKRTQLIRSLGGSSRFRDGIFLFLSDLLRLQTHNEAHGLGWHLWLRDRTQMDAPWDETVRQMLTATGHAAENPATGYYLRDRGMLLDNLSNTFQVFLGQQIGCAQCHDDPFGTTSRLDYYQLAAHLEHTAYRYQEGPRRLQKLLRGTRYQNSSHRSPESSALFKKRIRQEQRALATLFRPHHRNAISLNPSRQLKLPDDYQYPDASPGDLLTPIFPSLDGRPSLPRPHEGSSRVQLAQWVTSPQNVFFSRVMVNRLWAKTFGHSLVPNPDDWSDVPEDAYPQLIDHLGQLLHRLNYRLADFTLVLHFTQLFQAQTAPTEPYSGFTFTFTGPTLRRLSAEQLRDSLAVLNGRNGVSEDVSALSEHWAQYQSAFTHLQKATLPELRQIHHAYEARERKRRVRQKHQSQLRQELRQLRQAGKSAKARVIQKHLKDFRRQEKQDRKRSLQKAANIVQRTGPAMVRRLRLPEISGDYFSSALPAPAPPTSLRRQFGSSDRMTPMASHSRASIPQALRLLNGPETRSILRGAGRLAQELRKTPSPEARLQTLFLAFYADLPSPEERKIFLSRTRTPEDIRLLTRAFSTSNRFLFQP